MTDARTAQKNRSTGETDVSLELVLGGSGAGTRATGIGFFDHMLDMLARHGRFDLTVTASGDLETGVHHTVEDVGIALGQALDEALGDRAGIFRFGHAIVPMDEARAMCAIDVSGRPLLVFDGGGLPHGETAGFEHEMLEEFLRAVANGARITLHLEVQAGSNAHHMIEVSFKALARALHAATAIDPTMEGVVPSTKGTLT